MLKALFALIFTVLAVAPAMAYDNYAGSNTVIYEGYYDEEYQCKNVPQIRTVCGFERDCARFGYSGDCRDVPYCVKVGTFVKQCGIEYVHKIRPVTGSGNY